MAVAYGQSSFGLVTRARGRGIPPDIGSGLQSKAACVAYLQPSGILGIG